VNKPWFVVRSLFIEDGCCTSTLAMRRNGDEHRDTATASTFQEATVVAMSRITKEDIQVGNWRVSTSDGMARATVFVVANGVAYEGAATARSFNMAFAEAMLEAFNRSRGYMPLDASSAL